MHRILNGGNFSQCLNQKSAFGRPGLARRFSGAGSARRDTPRSPTRMPIPGLKLTVVDLRYHVNNNTHFIAF